ncbi:hypothetical protein GQ53DRAFT_832860 [Thozetella sp. PMI_491]|nr:hypothetical protein GQ53DRAFT_832860 [Thozetella sp. PMI_491]
MLCIQHVLLAALLVRSAVATLPVTIEVDLIFPRNDTYAPVAPMPIVWAVQGADGIPPLPHIIYWVIYDEHGRSIHPNPPLNLKNSSFTTSPYFAVAYTDGMNVTEGTWTLQWKWDMERCNNETNPHGFGSIGAVENTLVFSTRNGAKQPDIQPSDSRSCGSGPPALNITDINPVNGVDATFEQVFNCPVVANATVPANPCRVQVDAATASNLSTIVDNILCSALYGEEKNKCLQAHGKPNSGVKRFSIEGLGITGILMGLFMALTISLF